MTTTTEQVDYTFTERPYDGIVGDLEMDLNNEVERRLPNVPLWAGGKDFQPFSFRARFDKCEGAPLRVYHSFDLDGACIEWTAKQQTAELQKDGSWIAVYEVQAGEAW